MTHLVRLLSVNLQGHTETARLLLDSGANVNAKLTDGSTPLALAAWKGHTEVVRLVLARGANFRARRPSQPRSLWHYIYLPYPTP